MTENTTTAAPAATQPEAIGLALDVLREMLSDPDQRLDQCPARMTRANQAARALAGVQVAPAAQEAEPAPIAVPAALDHYLCQAWGETDLPVAAIVDGLDGVRAFLVEQWLGSEDAEADDRTRMLPAAMDDMQNNWRLEGEDWKWSVEFEIGGVSVQKVCAAAPQAPAAAVAPAEPKRQYISPVETIADLVNNLLTLDQSLPIYAAQSIEHGGRRRIITVPPMVSRERVKDGRWIGEGDALNAAVVWTRAKQPAAGEMLEALQLVASKLESRPYGTGSYIPKPIREKVHAAIANYLQTASAVAPAAARARQEGAQHER